MKQFEKPTLRALCYAHRIDVLKLHRVSGIDPLVIWDILRQVRTNRHAITMVLDGINDLIQIHYTIEDIEVAILK